MKFNIYWLVVGALVMVAVVEALRAIKRGKLRNAIFSELDNAYVNGYFASDEHLHNASPDEIAYDMTCYSPTFEDARPETLTPHVRDWLHQKGL